MGFDNLSLALTALIVATQAVLGWWLRLHGQTIDGLLIATQRIGAALTPTTIGGGVIGNGAPHPLAWLPAWSQRTGVLPDGNPDPQEYSDCGETCVAIVVAGVHGVPVEAGWIRQMLGGVQRSGLTDGADLVRALALCNISSEVVAGGAYEAYTTLRAYWAAAQPALILGRWLQGDALHWVIAWSWTPDYIGVIDPWTGTRRSILLADFRSKYANMCVHVTATAHYNMTGVPTPGSLPA
jgi:hypothetical protein